MSGKRNASKQPHSEREENFCQPSHKCGQKQHLACAKKSSIVPKVCCGVRRRILDGGARRTLGSNEGDGCVGVNVL